MFIDDAKSYKAEIDKVDEYLPHPELYDVYKCFWDIRSTIMNDERIKYHDIYAYKQIYDIELNRTLIDIIKQMDMTFLKARLS